MNKLAFAASAAVLAFAGCTTVKPEAAQPAPYKPAGSIRAVVPAAWNGDPNCWQMKRHAEKMNTVTNGGAKVVFIGDSITHFWESSDRGGLPVWKKFFDGEPFKALDLGTSADRTEHVLWRLTEGKELDGYEAKCILLMIGTNNSGHFPFDKEPPIDTILGIREILRVIREKQPAAKIVLTAIFPRGTDESDAFRVRNETVNKEICRFADGKNIFWVDFNDQFLTPDGLLPREVFPDLLHPGTYGYEVWAAAVKPYIDYALSDGRLPAPPNRYAPYTRASKFRMKEPLATYAETKVAGMDSWWLDRALQKRSQIAESKGEFDLVFLGDSITHNWDNNSGRATLAELRKTYSILNIGYSGDRTENVLWRIRNGEMSGYKTKCVMLMIGTNNTWHRKDKPEDIAAGVKLILEEIAKKQPDAKTLLLPIFPFGEGPEHPNRVNNEKVNAIIKGYADGEKVIWVDFNAKFLDAKGDMVKYAKDRCHPGPDGYREVWMPAVLPYFQKIVGK